MKGQRRRQFLKTSLVLGSWVSSGVPGLQRLLAAEAGFEFAPDQPLIPAPNEPGLWPEFRRQLTAWRERKRQELNYSDALYRRGDFRWVPSSFACCFLMLCDETFYDPAAGRYTVKKFLKEAQSQFGGFDSIVLWHAYPRIGFDDRNQFDFYRDVPGGLKGLRGVTGQLHDAGLKVFIDYNPWDTGTRREGRDDLEALAEMTASIQADGIFLDTMDRGAEAFRGRLDAKRKGVVLESEGALPLERVPDHHMSWAQWFADSTVPGVLRNKWFERRHMQHQIQRWNPDHTDELHAAWMNGSGMMIWENIFGTWNGWCARDRTLLRAMLPIQRRFAALFAGERWTPLVPTLLPDVYASLWEGEGTRLWTLINRSTAWREGPLLQVEPRKGERWFDLIAGRPILPGSDPRLPNAVKGSLAPRGLGCIVGASNRALGRGFERFLASQRALAAHADWSTTPPSRHTVLKLYKTSELPLTPTLSPSDGERENAQSILSCGIPTSTRAYSQKTMPEGMVAIPGAKLRLRTEFRVRECGFYDSTHPHFARKFPPLHGPLQFEREVTLRPYAMDLTPVTNAQFAAFLKASHYRPRHPENFLKHWVNSTPPPGKADHPVVYVDLDDARAYARWSGKRLPTEEEWQCAAQGGDGRKYPWGNEMLPGRCNSGETGGTTPVRAFPEGRSPFGLYDLCGNVWEWTESERTDGRTRFCIVRGGSYYRAKGSEWYADGGPQPCHFAAKFLLMWPGLDRCATIGFRCAADQLAGESPMQ